MHMDRRNFSVVQIVGYKNSGKTTLAEHLVRGLSALGVRVATIKHHGHGGKPSRAENTDSSKHLNAGAAAAAVIGDGEWQLTLTDRMPLNLEQMIELQRSLGAEFILMEGFKKAPYPKIVMLRDETDEELLGLENIIAVGGWDEPFFVNEQKLIFSLTDFSTYEKEMLELLMSR